jgi:pyridoxal phosphate enzyme (YggS family)
MNQSEEDVRARLESVRTAIGRAAERADRDAAGVTIVAAAKGVPAKSIRRAAEAGITAVGENYVRELLARRAELGDLAVRWHYIGALQTGTAGRVADTSDVVETVAGERAARRLAGRAARAGRTLDALIQVDFTDARAGVAPADVRALVDILSPLQSLSVRGLMTVAPITGGAEGARPFFARLRDLRDRVRERHPEVLDLSMGMSLDYEVAVEEGATMVRVGTALFGPRTP